MRHCTIIKPFINKYIIIYNGKTYKKVLIKNNMLGHKVGEFYITKKRAIFQPKEKKTDKKPEKKLIKRN